MKNIINKFGKLKNIVYLCKQIKINMETQTIDRENLKKIYDVACTNWKSKIESYANRNPFLDSIELKQSEIDEMFNASDDKQKAILNKFFKRPLGIMDRVKSFKDACNVLGLKIDSVFSSTDSKDDIAFKKLKVIIKALNEGWYPNWENEGEYKYFNYFKMKGVFSYWSTDNYCTGTSVPSALCLKSKVLAEYAVEIALEEYKEYYL